MRSWFSGSLSSLRAALAQPQLRRVQLALAGSTSGEFISIVALGLYAYQAGGATAVGVVSLVQMLPSMLFSPVTGVLGDRLRRELVVIGTDVVRALTMALAALAAALEAPVATVYALAAVLAIGSAAFYPAQSALVPLLASSVGDVTAACVAASLIRNMAGLLAPALAGAVLLVAGVPVLFGLAAAAFTFGALMLLGISRTDAVRRAPPMVGAFQELASGFRAAARDRGITLVLGLFAAHGVARGSVGVLLVVVPLELLETGEAGVGFLNAAVGVGGLAGAAATAGLVGRRTLAGPMALGLASTAAALLLAGILRPAAVAVTCLVAVGAGFAVVSVVGSTLLVRSTRDDVLARVLSVLGTVRSASMAAGAVLAPILVAVGGPRLALAATGTLLLVTVAAARQGVRALDARSQVPEDELRLLQASPVFAPILPLALERLAARLEPLVVPAGAEVVRQGDPGDYVYLIAEGGFEVESRGQPVSHLGPRGLFGEMALLGKAPRNATVRAVEESRIYRLDQDEFLAAVTGHPTSSRHVSELMTKRLEELRRVEGEL